MSMSAWKLSIVVEVLGVDLADLFDGELGKLLNLLRQKLLALVPDTAEDIPVEAFIREIM